MSQSLTITHPNSFSVGERQRAAKKKTAAESKITWNILLAALICIAGVLYIFEVNSVATQGFDIRNLEKKVQEKGEENAKLKIREAELRSIYNIEQKTKDLNMVAPKDVSYMSLPGNVAMK